MKKVFKSKFEVGDLVLIKDTWQELIIDKVEWNDGFVYYVGCAGYYKEYDLESPLTRRANISIQIQLLEEDKERASALIDKVKQGQK